MGVLTVEGTYRDGKVLLDEKPSFALDDSRVLVTFVPAAEDSAGSRNELLARITAHMDSGFKLGGAPYTTREEIYDERIRRFR